MKENEKARERNGEGARDRSDENLMGVELEPADETSGDIIKVCWLLTALFVGTVVSIIVMVCTV